MGSSLAIDSRLVGRKAKIGRGGRRTEGYNRFISFASLENVSAGGRAVVWRGLTDVHATRVANWYYAHDDPDWKVGMNHPRVGELLARSLGIMFFS